MVESSFTLFIARTLTKAVQKRFVIISKSIALIHVDCGLLMLISKGTNHFTSSVRSTSTHNQETKAQSEAILRCCDDGSPCSVRSIRAREDCTGVMFLPCCSSELCNNTPPRNDANYRNLTAFNPEQIDQNCRLSYEEHNTRGRMVGCEATSGQICCCSASEEKKQSHHSRDRAKQQDDNLTSHHTDA